MKKKRIEYNNNVIDLILCLFPTLLSNHAFSFAPFTPLVPVFSCHVIWEFYTFPRWCQRRVCEVEKNALMNLYVEWNGIVFVNVHFCFSLILFINILFMKNVLEAPQILWIDIYININLYIYNIYRCKNRPALAGVLLLSAVLGSISAWCVYLWLFPVYIWCLVVLKVCVCPLWVSQV